VPAQLGDLAGVLGEHEPARRVVEDVRALLGGRRRVDRGGGAARAQDAEVDQHPLVARVRQDADAILAAEAERQEARGQRLDPLAGGLPGQRAPLIADRVAVGFAIRRLADPLEKQRGDRAGRTGERFGRGRGGHAARILPPASRGGNAAGPR
jgi:hypothetical protein